MDVIRPVRRWRAYGKPQRTELYIRLSLYLIPLLQPLLVLLAVGAESSRGQTDPVLAGWAIGGGLAGGVVNCLLFRVGLTAYLGRRPRPTGWVLATGGLSLALAWTLLLIGPTLDGSTQTPPTVQSAVVTLTFWVAAATVALPVRLAATAALAFYLLALPAFLLAGTSIGTAAGAVTGSAVGGSIAAATCRASAWMAGVVWELDGAREAQARLAVAEERLRFSRDLHDVLGRNLTTIALKSELAVQLARRGRPEAVDQMTEVQRIAQESHREVRDVVRGYRTADLNAEITGARSVLRAADVACQVDLGPDAETLPGAAQAVLGWVVREAATNVLRHSEARHCGIRLRTAGGQAVLEVDNDGVTAALPGPRSGSDHGSGPASGPGGNGLNGLRERLAVHGGTLDTATTPGGFRLTATLPLTAGLEVAAR